MRPGSQGADDLVVGIGGPAGSGKTTLGRELATSQRLPLLDLDSVTNPLLDLLGADGPGGHWLRSDRASTIRAGRYAALREVARDVVATAGGAVLVAPFTAELRGGREWLLLQEALHPCKIQMIQLTGNEDLFAGRRAGRTASRDRYRPPSNPGPAATVPGIPVIGVPADLTTGQQLTRVCVALGRRTPLDAANPLFDNDFDAVLFDLDGSLVDSTASVIRSWHRFAVELDVPLEALHENHGQPARTLVERVLPPERTEAGLARITALEVADAAGVRPNIGASSLFASVPTDRRAIVTSGSVPIATARLAAAGLPRPGVLISSEDVPRGKPDPAPYLLAARRLGVEPTRCLVVEDAAAGIRSARAAGCQVLAVTGTEPVAQLAEAALVVDGLDRVTVQVEDGALRLLPRP